MILTSFQIFKVVLNLYTCILIVKKKVLFVDSFEKLKFISDEVWNDDEFVKKQGENGSGGDDVSESRGSRRVEDYRNKGESVLTGEEPDPKLRPFN